MSSVRQLCTLRRPSDREAPSFVRIGRVANISKRQPAAYCHPDPNRFTRSGAKPTATAGPRL